MTQLPTIVSCHQPNFLPWLGFFAKVARSDIFILLDDVQFTQGHNKHNWTTRVRIATSNGPIWLSVPVTRSGMGLQKILDIRTPEDDRRWLIKMIKTIKESYLKMPFFSEIFPRIEGILSSHKSSLCETNILLIEELARVLNLRARIVRSSTIDVRSTSTNRLVDLTLACGGKIYLSGDGAADYQVNDAFNGAGIETRKLAFQHPIYPQRRKYDFVAGLSVFDAMCSVGLAATRELAETASGFQREVRGV